MPFSTVNLELDLLKEVHKDDSGAIYQCSQTNTIWLNFQGVTSPLTYFNFLEFKSQVDDLDVLSLINNPTPGCDLEIINVNGCERCFLVNWKELIDLKDLLDGAKVMLTLDCIIQERLYHVLV